MFHRISANETFSLIFYNYLLRKPYKQPAPDQTICSLWEERRVANGGENRMKKVAVVVLAFALLMIMPAVTPALAMNSKWIPVVITRTGAIIDTGAHWFTEGDTYHLRDTAVGFGGYSVKGTGISYVGSSSGTMVAGNMNLKTMEGKQTTQSHIAFPGGNFDGVIHMQGTFNIVLDTAPAENVRGYMVPIDVTFVGRWHGTGAYAGQTMILEYEVVKGVSPSVLIGYLFIP